MKAANLILSLVLASGLLACSQITPIPRDELASNLAPILQLEKRVDQAKYYTHMLVDSGGMSSDKAQDLKAHHDVYYVYYLGSIVHLARGDKKAYLDHVRLAARELDVMEAIIKDQLLELVESERKERFSKSGL